MSTRRSKGSVMFVDVAKSTENRQAVVREIVVEGNEKTSDNLIRTQLEVKPGDVLNLQKLSASRRNLYHTGAYSIVEITRTEITPDAAGQSADRGTNPQPFKKPVRLTVK